MLNNERHKLKFFVIWCSHSEILPPMVIVPHQLYIFFLVSSVWDIFFTSFHSLCLGKSINNNTSVSFGQSKDEFRLVVIIKHICSRITIRFTYVHQWISKNTSFFFWSTQPRIILAKSPTHFTMHTSLESRIVNCKYTNIEC